MRFDRAIFLAMFSFTMGAILALFAASMIVEFDDVEQNQIQKGDG